MKRSVNFSIGSRSDAPERIDVYGPDGALRLTGLVPPGGELRFRLSVPLQDTEVLVQRSNGTEAVDIRDLDEVNL